MQRVANPDTVLAWIPETVRDDGDLCGMDVMCWEDATWILHDLTVPLDKASAEDGPRERRRWQEVSSVDFEVALRENRWPPNSRYLLKDQNWPDICVEEGVFDGESFAVLFEILIDISGPDGACFAFYGQVPANDYDTPTVLEGPLSAIPGLTQDTEFRELSPSNWWPADRSWFVWTDYDLTATKVSGPRSLIDRIRAHPSLETAEWQRPNENHLSAAGHTTG